MRLRRNPIRGDRRVYPPYCYNPVLGKSMSHIARSTQQRGRRGDVLRLLRAADAPMSIVAIADQLDVHPNTVRFHLDALHGAGRVEQVASHRKGPGRPALLFKATRLMDPGGPQGYRVLAELLVADLAHEQNADVKALAAGQAWGRHLQPPAPTTDGPPGMQTSIDFLVGLLDELGFAPEHRGDEGIGLRHCPFLELAKSQKAVVCPIHLGIMRGALETWDASVTVDRLDAFVEPDLCMARLARRVGAE